jgi:hypothetical protein
MVLPATAQTPDSQADKVAEQQASSVAQGWVEASLLEMRQVGPQHPG